MDRRGFLRQAARLFLASPPLVGLVASCTRATTRSTAKGSISSTTPAPSLTGSSPSTLRWDDLASTIRGRLIRPGTAAYPDARRNYNPRFDGVRPRAVVMAASSDDVSRTTLFAREHGLAFAARSGGHSYGGYSLSDGIVIDVSAMATVRPDPSSGSVTVGAGATTVEIAAGLAQDGVVLPTGTCPTVGIAGLTMGGGQGVLGRRFGLTCDSLRAATVVLADGSVVTCDRSTESDLFWALRGGGGGNLGVVTSFTFATHPLTRLTAFAMSWPWSEAEAVLAAWQIWGPAAPPSLWSSCRLRWIPGSGPLVSVSGAWSDVPAGLRLHLDELASAVPTATSRSTRTMSSLDAAMYFGGCSGSSIEECRLQIRGGRLAREGSLAKSDFFDGSIPPDVIRAVLGQIEARGATGALAAHAGGVLFDAWGGEIAATAPDATAFPRRHARFLAQEFVTFGATIPEGELEENRRWLAGLWRAFRPAASGFAYLNYIDPELPNWLHAYYGDNLVRLVETKRRYDPDDVFRFAQSVPTAMPA